MAGIEIQVHISEQMFKSLFNILPNFENKQYLTQRFSSLRNK